MSGIVLTFPIKSGKVEAWRRFCQELSGTRRQMYEASRLRLGITRERLALVETAFGSAAVMTFEAADIGRVLGQITALFFHLTCGIESRCKSYMGVNLAKYEKFLQPVQPAG